MIAILVSFWVTSLGYAETSPFDEAMVGFAALPYAERAAAYENFVETNRGLILPEYLRLARTMVAAQYSPDNQSCVANLLEDPMVIARERVAQNFYSRFATALKFAEVEQIASLVPKGVQRDVMFADHLALHAISLSAPDAELIARKVSWTELRESALLRFVFAAAHRLSGDEVLRLSQLIVRTSVRDVFLATSAAKPSRTYLNADDIKRVLIYIRSREVRDQAIEDYLGYIRAEPAAAIAAVSGIFDARRDELLRAFALKHADKLHFAGMIALGQAMITATTRWALLADLVKSQRERLNEGEIAEIKRTGGTWAARAIDEALAPATN